MGDNQEAWRLNQQFVERLRQTGETGARYVSALGSLAESLRRLGDDTGAAPLFEEALRAAGEAHVFTWVPETLDSVAALIASRAPERGAMLMGAADSARRETGLVVYDASAYAATRRAVCAQLEPEQFEAAWSEGTRKSLPEAMADAIETLSAPHSGDTSRSRATLFD